MRATSAWRCNSVCPIKKMKGATMKINKIAWTNYKGLTDGEIVADGNNVIISGRNGAGKSSIASIVPFVLFGADSRSLKSLDLDSDDYLVHSADIFFDNGKSFRRDYLKKDGRSYSNELFIDGSPVKARRFSAEVDKLTNGGNELVLNPFFFCDSLSADEQRNLLFDVCGTLSDAEILDRPEFAPVDKILNGLPAEQFLLIAKDKIKSLRSKVATIAPRVDELQILLDNSALDNFDCQQAANQLADLRLARQNVPALSDSLQKIADDISNKKNQRTILAANFKKNADLFDSLQKRKAYLDARIKDFSKRLHDLREKFSSVATEKPGICPTCQQPIPVPKFNAARNSRLEAITVDGKNCKADLDSLVAELADVNQHLSNLAPQGDLSFSELDNQIADLQNSFLQQKADFDTKRQQQLAELDNQIADLDKKIAAFNEAQSWQKRIEDLRTQEDSLKKQISELELEIDAVKNFSRQKINLVEDKINNHFDHVKFKLFSFVMSTGELKPTCEPTLHGVPYSALSKGERLKAALDIFKALQAHFKTDLPLFLDDAESYTANSFDGWDNQLWLFKVTDDDLNISIQN